MRFALLRHDAAITSALARQVARRGRDLPTVLVALPVLALFARSWLGELPAERREVILVIAAFLIAAALARALVGRLEYHRTEGALAHFAQRSTDAVGYVLPPLLVGLAVLLASVRGLGGLMGTSTVIGIVAGVIVGLIAAALRLRLAWLATGLVPRGKHVMEGSHLLPLAAASSGLVGLVCALLPSETYLAAMVAGGYALMVALLAGQVDAAVVRYMAMVGRSAADLLRRWLPLQLALLVPAAAVLALSQSGVAAGIAALAAFGLPAFTILRVLAYRAFDRMPADWLVTIIVAITAYLMLSLPPLGPLAILAAMVWLARRGRGARWLIA
ncbi:hypothetical protein I5L01_10390 [Erythrobacter sp. YJ-T3-07]|uniref:hypothetical protein n=1 Tax=Erythrobacter sp. YJ-T3-07 TaxID=2793063 RepID=UPI0018D32421|nr:hypothetical protein [Erythrobacter sp. YJ-T3-07]MBH1944640.1 hypothetical protein [Erythrobacter sp. YJ-T3-07]